MESRGSSREDSDDPAESVSVAQQLPTPRGGAGGAVYPGGGPGSKAGLSRDEDGQGETFTTAAERRPLRKKAPSQAIPAANETSSKFSSPGKSGGKPLAERRITTKTL
jgi:hypothetical protein